MLPLNSSHIPSTFLLMGLPGSEVLYGWISLPFCCMFSISIAGNMLILHMIIRDYKLHQPMYLFLALLATTDLLFSLVTSPSVLGIFLFHYHSIRSPVCLFQMFFIHSLSVTESSLLLAMAYDRFVAICHPLRYRSILTRSMITKIGVISALRGALTHVPPVTSLLFLPYCKGNALSHSYCLHQDVMKLACDGTNTFNIMFGLAVILCTFTLDLFLIILSYVRIIQAVLDVTSKMERYRLINTCVSHLCAVFMFYVPIVTLSIVHRFGIQVSPVFINFMANTYLFVPPMLNPIIYSIKSKQIHVTLYQMFYNRKLDL